MYYRQSVRVGEWDIFKGLDWSPLSTESDEIDGEFQNLFCKIEKNSLPFYPRGYPNIAGGHKRGAPLRYEVSQLQLSVWKSVGGLSGIRHWSSWCNQ